MAALCVGLVEAGSFDVCGYTRYCRFCTTECPKCEDANECASSNPSKRPPNCKYCPWCRVCPVCSTAVAVCKAVGNWVDWASNAILSQHAEDAKSAPGHDAIQEDLRKANVRADEL